MENKLQTYDQALQGLFRLTSTCLSPASLTQPQTRVPISVPQSLRTHPQHRPSTCTVASKHFFFGFSHRCCLFILQSQGKLISMERPPPHPRTDAHIQSSQPSWYWHPSPPSSKQEPPQSSHHLKRTLAFSFEVFPLKVKVKGPCWLKKLLIYRKMWPLLHHTFVMFTWG